MDVFAAGCVLAELFTDGEPLFDYSRLLAFRQGDYNPGAAIAALDPGVRDVVGHMTQLDPGARLSAAEYVDMFAATVLPPAIPAVLHPFVGRLMSLEGSRRAEEVASSYPRLKHILENYQAEEPSLYMEESQATSEALQHPPSLPEKGEGLPASLAGRSSVPVGDDVFGYEISSIVEESRALLAETRAALTAFESKRMHEGGHALPREIQHGSIPTRAGDTKQAQRAEEEMRITQEKEGNEEESVNDGSVLVLGLLCSVLRGSRHQSVRVRLIHQIADCALRCGDDEARLQRAVPQLVAAASDPQFSVVRSAALCELPRVLACVRQIPPGEVRSFVDYLLPSLSLLPMDPEAATQAAYAGALGALAAEAYRALEESQLLVEKPIEEIENAAAVLPQNRQQASSAQVHYDEELSRLRGAVERAVHDLLVGARAEPKLALLPHLHQMSRVLGRRDSADELLPALLTLFNAREWEVRAALYCRLSGVCTVLGPQSMAFLIPFLDRMLSDPEPAAVAAAVWLLADLSAAGLLRQRHILNTIGKIIDCGAFDSECTAVRAAAIDFIVTASRSLRPVTSAALLLPLIRPVIEKDPVRLDKVDALTEALRWRKFAPGGAAAASPPSTAPGIPATSPPPATSYSISIDPVALKRGASKLRSALTQVQHDTMPLGGRTASVLVTRAQRTLTLDPKRTLVRPAGGLDGTFSQPSTESVNSPPPGQPNLPAAPAALPWRPRGVLLAHLAEHHAPVSRLASLSGTQLFVSASEDGTAKLWDVRRLERDITFRARATYEGHRPNAGVRAACGLGATTSGMVATGDSKGWLHVWCVERAGDRTAGWRLSGVMATKPLGKNESGNGPEGSGAVMDLSPWGTDAVVVASVRGGCHAVDVRSASIGWHLACPPADGAVTRVVCDQNNMNWTVTGTTRGVLTLWDIRFLLPFKRWMHPTGARVEAMSIAPGALGTKPTSRSGAPVVLVAAGRDEAAAWDVADGSCKGVIRLIGSGLVGRQTPEALASTTPESALGTASVDPLARARRLGATELRTLAPRKPGFRTLFATSGGQVLSGGTDCAVRCWDWGEPSRSYVVLAPPPLEVFAAPVSYSYEQQRVQDVLTVEEHSEKNAPVSEEDRDARLATRAWWERAAAVCHCQTVVDVIQVEGQTEPLLASGSMDGVVKVWR